MLIYSINFSNIRAFEVTFKTSYSKISKDLILENDRIDGSVCINIIRMENYLIFMNGYFGIDKSNTLYMFRFVTQKHIHCSHTVRIGNYADGGWDMCVVAPYTPKKPCIVYSFG